MSNPDQSPALSLEEFRHWLNNRRMMDVSMAFGDIVERYREATEAAAMAATVPAEPVYWEFRWKDTHPQTVTSGQWYPWEKVVPRNGHLETVESRLAELRYYIAQGKCYEIRALYAAQPLVAGQPAEPSPASPAADAWATVAPAVEANLGLYREVMTERGQGPSQAARDVLAERARQISAEGWTPEHDDSHTDGSLAKAASCYAQVASGLGWKIKENPPAIWPWSHAWWKPTTARNDLIKAGALILAEIERLDRDASVEARYAPKGDSNG